MYYTYSFRIALFIIIFKQNCWFMVWGQRSNNFEKINILESNSNCCWSFFLSFWNNIWIYYSNFFCAWYRCKWYWEREKEFISLPFSIEYNCIFNDTTTFNICKRKTSYSSFVNYLFKTVSESANLIKPKIQVTKESL